MDPDAKPAAPNDEERLLAAACHLAIFLAVPIFAPIAVYVWKRKESSFVAFHALQATLVAVLTIPASLVMWGALSAVGIAVGSALDPRVAPFVVPAAFLFGLGFPWVATFVVAFVAGFKALKGQTWSIPIVGRIAKSVVDAGPGSVATQHP